MFLDWLQWVETPSLPGPYEEPNHVGIIRCALEVDNLDSTYEILKASEWNKSYSIIMGPPEEWDLGPEWGSQRVLNFKDPEGVFLQFIEQRKSPLATLHPFGKGAEL
jgi:hypothetical protein